MQSKDPLPRPLLLGVAVSCLIIQLPLSYNSASADEPPSSCDISVTASTDSLLLKKGAETITMPLKTTEGINERTLKISGKEYRVKAWSGASKSPLDVDAPGNQAELDKLAKRSLEGASKDGDGVVVETHATPPAEEADFTPVAVRIDDPATGRSEYTSLEDGASLKAGGGASREAQKCISVEGPLSVPIEAESTEGRFTFPQSTEQALALPPTWVVGYRTFIPPAQVNTGIVCGLFTGDNRTFTSNTSASSRTSVRATMNFQYQKLSTEKVVGATHRLAGYGRSAMTRTASTDGIHFVSPMITSSYARVQVTHSVGNPLCNFAGPISYNALMEGWRDGSVRILGSAVKVPAHEAYYYKGGATTGKHIFHFGASRFYCLSVNCGNIALDFSA